MSAIRPLFDDRDLDLIASRETLNLWDIGIGFGPVRADSEYRGDALLPTEREVIDLWDAGLSIQQIAKRLQRRVGGVASIVSRFHRGPEDADWHRMVVAGSKALAAAIAATGKVFR